MKKYNGCGWTLNILADPISVVSFAILSSSSTNGKYLFEVYRPIQIARVTYANPHVDTPYPLTFKVCFALALCFKCHQEKIPDIKPPNSSGDGSGNWNSREARLSGQQCPEGSGFPLARSSLRLKRSRAPQEFPGFFFFSSPIHSYLFS